ncbi:hypothetical protein [Streptomyces sp. RPT161]|nr:hypothetical protein [Streptomyces sp. RPT161]
MASSRERRASPSASADLDGEPVLTARFRDVQRGRAILHALRATD